MNFHNIDFFIYALLLFCIYKGSKFLGTTFLLFLKRFLLMFCFLDYFKLNSVTAKMLPEMRECLCHSEVGTKSQPMRKPWAEVEWWEARWSTRQPHATACSSREQQDHSRQFQQLKMKQNMITWSSSMQSYKLQDWQSKSNKYIAKMLFLKSITSRMSRVN